MDETTHSFDLKNQAQLWLGPAEHLADMAEQYLQKQFCKKKGCATCITCQKIRQRQHHAIVWLSPEKGYTLEQLDIIFETITLTVEEGQQFFFVLQKADCLTPATGNRLLKSIEEPPPGYYFLLLAHQYDAVLPTIRSRCAIRSLYTKSNSTIHADLMRFFTATHDHDPSEFLKTVDTSKINEQESLTLLDQILEYWLEQSIQLTTQQKSADQAQYKVKILINALLAPPMPGSSKLFWKNLFIQVVNPKSSSGK
jgi:hypothetical protein